MVTSRDGQRLGETAGRAGEAKDMCCSGHRVHQEKVEKCDWSKFIAGPKPHYVTSPPPEMKVRPGPGERRQLPAAARNRPKRWGFGQKLATKDEPRRAHLADDYTAPRRQLIGL